MFARLFRFLESRIDIFAPFNEDETPPTGVWRFMWHHLKVVKGWLAAIMLIELAFSGIEAAIYLMVGWFVDLLNKQSPQTVFQDYGWPLAGAAFIILVLRPILFFVTQVVTNQIVVPPLTNQIRWRNHIYTLGHSLTYFQNDFAGRLSARVIQAGQSIRSAVIAVIGDLWYALIFASVTIGFFGSVNVWLKLPVIVWLAAYAVLLRYFVPRALKRSEANSLGRSSTTGRIVDSYTNILTVKLFARGDLERTAVRDSLKRWNDSFLDLMRLILGASLVLQILNSILIVITAGLTLYFWSHGAMTAGAGAAAIALVLRLVQMSGWLMYLIRDVFDNIGTVQESMLTIAKPHDLVDASGAGTLSVPRGEIVFDHVHFRYGGWQARLHRSVARHPPGRKDRHCRPLRRRQIDIGQSPASSLSDPVRPHPHRRSGHCRRHPGQPAAAYRCGHTGQFPAPSLNPGKHRLWPHRGRTRRNRDRVPAGGRP
jgi:ATP-binding cassette subfamily B multidrug efflux pump